MGDSKFGRRLNPTEGYDGKAKRANKSYAKTGDIQETIKDKGLPSLSIEGDGLA